MKQAKKFSAHPLAYPLTLLFLGAGTYLMLAPWLGFYWDDWQAVYLAQSGNPRLIWDYFAYDRPLSAWTYTAAFPLLGLHPPVWQVCTLLLRWLGIWALVSALDRAWPELRYALRWAGALMMVYPAFSLQSVSVAFSQHFVTFALFAVSLWLSARAVSSMDSVNRRRAWLWTLPAWITCLAHLFTMEYFVGLEVLRPILIYKIRRQQGLTARTAFGQAFLNWLPYVGALLLFGYWRFGYYPAHFPYEGANDPLLLGQILKAPLDGLRVLVSIVENDTFNILLRTWLENVSPEALELSTKAGLLGLGMGMLVSLLCLFYTELECGNVHSTLNGRGARLGLALAGLITLFFGGLPVWLAGRQSMVGKWSDRFTLAILVGAVLLLVSVLDEIVKPHRRGIILALLLCFGVAAQVRTVNKYRLDWDYQRDFYWQLYWRAPDLLPDTAVFSWITPTDKMADYPMGFALNTLYADGPVTNQARYWFFLPRSLGYHFARFAPGELIRYSFRNIRFTGSTSQAIAVAYRPARACLRLLDPVYRFDPRLEADDLNLLPVSNPDRVILEGSTPRRDVFGAEPMHGWCYYYQKADLARSQQDWDAVLALMEQAESAGLEPKDGAELLPLIEAYANTGQWRRALETSQRALRQTDGLGKFLCVHWQRYSQIAGSAEAVRKAQELFNCWP